MQKALFCLCTAAAVMLSGCGNENGGADSRPLVYAGIAPVRYILNEIGGDRITAGCALREGNNPHAYSPTPADAAKICNAKIYFSIGMPFESNIIEALSGCGTAVVDLRRGMRMIPFDAECIDEELPDDNEEHRHGEDEHGHHHHGGENDPHVWLSPDNAMVAADSIAAELSAIDPEGAAVYRENLLRFRGKMMSTKDYIYRTLAPYEGREFLVFHPAFGYFADTAGMKQISIEHGGHDITSARMAAVIKAAEQRGIKAVFVQPQFNPANAAALKEALNAELFEVDPLEENFDMTVRHMADYISASFEDGRPSSSYQRQETAEDK